MQPSFLTAAASGFLRPDKRLIRREGGMTCSRDWALQSCLTAQSLSITVIATLLLCLGCGGSQPQQAEQQSSEARLLEPGSASATPSDLASTPVAVANRTDCNVIRGTAYNSEDERGWFLANCLTPTPTVAPLTPTPTQQALFYAPPASTAAQPTPATRDCAAWPPEVAAVLQILPTPPGVCLIRGSDPSGCGGTGACYFHATRTVLFLFNPGRNTDFATLTHEVCHAHQHFLVLQAGLPERPFDQNWYQTAQGKSFLAADLEPWLSGWVPPNPLEDMADTCALWYIATHEQLAILNVFMPKRLHWAQEWLPK
jgi:hypothetical protein